MAMTQLFMMTRSGGFENSVLIYYWAELFLTVFELRHWIWNAGSGLLIPICKQREICDPGS
jgi:hypothetical protein